MIILCSYCKAPFEPSYPEQRYCRRNHSLAARRVRAKHRRREAARAFAKGDRLCPRPDKKGYSSPQQAAHSWEAKQRVLVLYRCRCGALHFGHRFGALRPTRSMT